MTKYVVVGDSQAEGLGMSVALPRVLGDDLVRIEGHPGFSTEALRGAISTAAGVAANNDATLLIFSGGNDNNVLASAESLERYKNVILETVRTIARKSATTGKAIKVIWFGPAFALQAWNARMHPQAQQAQRSILGSSAVSRAIAEETGARVSIRWVDLFPLTRDLAREEDVHLTADGYRTLAPRVVSAAESGGGGILGLALAAGAAYVGWRWYRGGGSW
jgi:lysophospholipase L1-like esterase